jgi:signal transduction histidine kinase
VRQLEALYPYLREEEPEPASTSTIGAPVEHLDLATVIKVSQAVSSEIVLDKLIDTLMRTAIEHAGAQRGLLILPRGAEWRIEAEATTSGDIVMVRLREDLVAGTAAPEALQKAQAELAHVTRVATLGEMTASIAHEVSQPLGAVVTNASASLRWLSRNSPDLDEAREAIRRVVRDGKRAGDVISRMRALFKKASTTKQRLDINEVIEEVLTLAHSEVQRNRVSLQTKLADDLPPVLGDRIQLQQVILNLLINAVQAMSELDDGLRELWVCSNKVNQIPAEPDIEALYGRARVEAEWTHVLIAVRDSGPGLDPKSVDRLFDAFYTTKPQGVGMGLAISRSIIEAHRGRLWATANYPRGAIFQFTLPL